MISQKPFRGPEYACSPLKMLTRKSFLLIAIASISTLVLIYTARIGAWPAASDLYYQVDPHKSQHAPQGSKPASPPPVVDPACEGFPDTSKVLVVVKTGASEAYARVPTQMMTMLKCLPDYLIFSDMDQDIGGQQIHDSLSTVLPEAMEDNPDFDLYRRQQWCPVDQDNCNKLGDPAREGWSLDKYKNVHIAEKTYAMRPGYDWYLFIDADTYVLWPNLMKWIKKLDPTKKLYLGSVTLIGGFQFGHGGSGYLVSQAAMHDMVGKNPGVANEYDVRAKGECCGDYIFAVALNDKTETGVQQMWPTINGEKPATLPFGPSHWCHPIVTMHHMNAEEINAFWAFERRRTRELAASGQARPLVIKDIYDEFLAPHLNDTREDWDNMADNRYYLDTESGAHRWEDWQLKRMKNAAEYNDAEKHAHESFEACGAACKSLGPTECFRYKYEKGSCGISNSFIMGKPVKREWDEAKRVMSGWDVDKINKWIKKQGTCGKVHWPHVKTDEDKS